MKKYILGIIVFMITNVLSWIFTIPSESMYPTLKPGDKVVVNKLLMGGRIYKNLHIDKEGQELESWRQNMSFNTAITSWQAKM